MQKAFVCSTCGKLFEPNWPSSTRYRLKKNGAVYCSKNCASTKHKMFKSSEYRSWQAMKQRCNNLNQEHYDRYGGRGINFDPSWEDFSVFFKDMGKKPTPSHQLERIDNNKNYCKENCIWATRKEQTRNRGGARATRLYTYDGKTMCIKDWAQEVGISPASMQKRLNNGWPLEKAFSKVKHDGPELFTFEDKTMSIAEWSKYLNVPTPTLRTRIKKGLPPEKIFTNEKFNKWNINNS